MNLSSLVPIFVFVFCLFAAILVVIFLAFDTIDKAEGLTKRLPWLAKSLGKKEAIPAFLLILVLLLILNGYELATKEIPEIPEAPKLTLCSADPGAKNAEVQELKNKLAYMQSNPLVKLEASKPPTVPSETSSHKREIQDKLTQFITDGIKIRDGWRGVVGTPEDQRPYANEVRQWHTKLENYIRTIPRGGIYLARLNSATRTDFGYPIGINMNVGGNWDLLVTDLATLNQFTNDPDLGTP